MVQNLKQTLFYVDVALWCYKWMGWVGMGMCNTLELLGQYPQRNYLSKSATFDPIFQLLHSALLEITIIVVHKALSCRLVYPGR